MHPHSPPALHRGGHKREGVVPPGLKGFKAAEDPHLSVASHPLQAQAGAPVGGQPQPHGGGQHQPCVITRRPHTLVSWIACQYMCSVMFAVGQRDTSMQTASERAADSRQKQLHCGTGSACMPPCGTWGQRRHGRPWGGRGGGRWRGPAEPHVINDEQLGQGASAVLQQGAKQKWMLRVFPGRSASGISVRTQLGPSVRVGEATEGELH